MPVSALLADLDRFSTMFSRVADSLYWMSRYLERAEHTARLVDVNLNLMLEQGPWRAPSTKKCCLQSLNIELDEDQLPLEDAYSRSRGL